MNVTEFLKDKLSHLAMAFPNVRIKYTYNESIATHIVQLTPETEYHNNDALDKAWVPISIEFMETFLAEDVCFVSSDSRLAITKPEMEWNQPVQEWEMPAMNELFTSILQSSPHVEFPKTFSWEEAIDTHITIESIHTEYKQINNLAGFVMAQLSTKTSGQYQFVKAEGEVPAGNTQYAMAA